MIEKRCPWCGEIIPYRELSLWQKLSDEHFCVSSIRCGACGGVGTFYHRSRVWSRWDSSRLPLFVLLLLVLLAFGYFWDALLLFGVFLLVEGVCRWRQYRASAWLPLTKCRARNAPPEEEQSAWPVYFTAGAALSEKKQMQEGVILSVRFPAEPDGRLRHVVLYDMHRGKDGGVKASLSFLPGHVPLTPPSPGDKLEAVQEGKSLLAGTVTGGESLRSTFGSAPPANGLRP